MLTHRVVAQPLKESEYGSLVASAFKTGPIARLDVAVAYATPGGVQAFLRVAASSLGTAFDAIEKRWLVGIDWMRSSPSALDAISRITNSSLRIHDGKHVVAQVGCVPRLPFHPKTYLFTGKQHRAAVIGSGNLSKNGMLYGHEVGIMIVVSNPADASEQNAADQVVALESWFDKMWANAPAWTTMRTRYRATYTTPLNFGALAPTDDDTADSTTLLAGAGGRSFSPSQLKQLRAADDFWIEAGTLTKNRGPSLPGNQLMMKRFSRVFFGFKARDVPRDTHVGEISVRYKSAVRDDCSIRYSNNGMDVLTLPVPDQGGPPLYDKQVLLFERRTDGAFDLTVQPSSAVKALRMKSEKLGSAFQMTSGRGFGVY